MSPINVAADNSTVNESRTSLSPAPGPSKRRRTSTQEPKGRVRRALEEPNSSTPKRKKIKLSDFQYRKKDPAPVGVDDDSDDSIGPSISLRGASTPKKRQEKENREIERPVQNTSISSSTNQGRAVVRYSMGQIRPRISRKKNFWSPEETEWVRLGFERYGTTCRKIHERFFPADSPRTIENIRDKIKTMQRRGEL